MNIIKGKEIKISITMSKNIYNNHILFRHIQHIFQITTFRDAHHSSHLRHDDVIRHYYIYISLRRRDALQFTLQYISATQHSVTTLTLRLTNTEQRFYENNQY